MTDTSVTQWNKAIDRYRQTVNRLSENVADELPAKFVAAQRKAGMALFFMPARELTHVAQKIRVANNIFGLHELHPELEQILLDDLTALAGIERGILLPTLP